MNRADLLRIFFEEAVRHLDVARALTNHEAALDPAQWNELFRALHSVKGMAAALGLDELAQLLHDAESDVDQARRGVVEEPEPLRRRVAERVDEIDGRVRGLAHDPFLIEDAAAAPRQSIAGSLPSSRVDAPRLDRLLEIAMRLSAAHQRLEHWLGPAEEAQALTIRDALQEAVRALRREVLEMRLAPVQWLVPLLSAALDRWGTQRGVEAALVVVGEAVAVDRLILEGMLDPLAQLLRNAVVHGIESRAEREQARKPVQGKLTLRVERSAERVLIVFKDDGRGIDEQAVRARARQRGHAALADAVDPLQLLTLPDMSGRQSADLLAGRGMGLSAVHHAVERLGGSLTLSSAPGRGFQAAISVPTRIAILPLFLVEAGGQTFGVPVASVREVRLAGKFRRGAAQWDDLPAVALTEAMGRPDPLAARTASAALTVGEEKPLLLLVDRVLGRRELVCRPLGPPLDELPFLTGAALLAEGGLALVVDPLPLTRHWTRTHGTMPA